MTAVDTNVSKVPPICILDTPGCGESYRRGDRTCSNCGQPHAGRRGPVPRSDNDILITQQMVLEAILAELQRSNSIERSGSVSSVEIKDLASGKPQVTTKVYAGSPVGPLVDEALAEHARAHREAEARAMTGWRETVDGLAAERTA